MNLVSFYQNVLSQGAGPHLNRDTNAPILILDTDMNTDCDDALPSPSPCSFTARTSALAQSSAASRQYAAYTRRAEHGLEEVPWVLMSLSQSSAYTAYIDQLRTKNFLSTTNSLPASTVWCRQIRAGLMPSPLSPYRRRCRPGAVICAVSILALLLVATAQKYSIIHYELVKRKVRELVTMVNALPQGEETFNWRMDAANAASAIANWPTPITVSWCGSDILTSPPDQPPGNPIHEAYRIWQRGKQDLRRSSWDLIATLWTSGLHTDLFIRRTPAQLSFNQENAHYQYLKRTLAICCLYPNTSNEAIHMHHKLPDEGPKALCLKCKYYENC